MVLLANPLYPREIHYLYDTLRKKKFPSDLENNTLLSLPKLFDIKKISQFEKVVWDKSYIGHVEILKVIAS